MVVRSVAFVHDLRIADDRHLRPFGIQSCRPPPLIGVDGRAKGEQEIVFDVEGEPGLVAVEDDRPVFGRARVADGDLNRHLQWFVVRSLSVDEVQVERVILHGLDSRAGRSKKTGGRRSRGSDYGSLVARRRLEPSHNKARVLEIGEEVQRILTGGPFVDVEGLQYQRNSAVVSRTPSI